MGAFEEAAKRKPDSPVITLNLADALTGSGQPARAVPLLARTLKTAPDNALLWYQLGIAHSAAGHDAEAIAAFEKSVALDPDLTEAHNLLGAALAGGGDLERAERELRRALQINPDYPDALGNLGHLLAARGNLAEAAFYFARAVQLKPGDAEIRTNYAVTLGGPAAMGGGATADRRGREGRSEIERGAQLSRHAVGARRQGARGAGGVSGSRPIAARFRPRASERRANSGGNR